MAEDVTEKHMDLSWIMNSSTTIDLLSGSRIYFERVLGNQWIVCFRTSDIVNIKLVFFLRLVNLFSGQSKQLFYQSRLFLML